MANGRICDTVQKFYNFLFEQGTVATPNFYHIFSFFAILEKAFIRNEITILCINYILITYIKTASVV